MLTDVNFENFQEKVLDSKEPVLIDFTATWCGPCRKLAPVIEEVENALSDKIKVAKIDADENRELLINYAVSGVPTLLLFKDGEPVERMVGLVSKSTIISNIEKHI